MCCYLSVFVSIKSISDKVCYSWKFSIDSVVWTCNDEKTHMWKQEGNQYGEKRKKESEREQKQRKTNKKKAAWSKQGPGNSAKWLTDACLATKVVSWLCWVHPSSTVRDAAKFDQCAIEASRITHDTLSIQTRRLITDMQVSYISRFRDSQDQDRPTESTAFMILYRWKSGWGN